MAGDRQEGSVVRGRFGDPAASAGSEEQRRQAGEQRIPIVEEGVRVGKREVETGRVRVHTVVDEEKLNLTEVLERDVVEVERVPVGREVEQAPLPFEDGDVLVIPVIEERLVVEKRLVVVEEVRIRRRQTREDTEVPVTRRVMRADIERMAPPSPSPSPGPPIRRDEPLASERHQAAFSSSQSQDRERGPDPAAARHAGSPAPGKGLPWTAIAVGVLVLLILLLALASGD